MTSQHRISTDPPAFIEIVIVQVEDCLFAVDVHAALEVRGREPLLAGPAVVPSQKRVKIRGNLLSVLDLREHLDLGAYEDHCPAMLLLCIDSHTMAIAVDDVPIIHSIPYSHLGPLHVSAVMAPFCLFSIEVAPGKRVPLLDPQALLRAMHAA